VPYLLHTRPTLSWPFCGPRITGKSAVTQNITPLLAYISLHTIFLFGQSAQMLQKACMEKYLDFMGT